MGKRNPGTDRNNFKGKESFLASLKLSPQPVVLIKKLNIPKSFQNETTNNFSINIKSKQFKLLVDSDTERSKYKLRFSKVDKPKSKVRRKTKKNLVKSESDPMTSTKVGTSKPSPAVGHGDELRTDGPCRKKIESVGLSQLEDSNCESKECKSESADYETLNPESMTRTDKMIDNFLLALRKITDDDSILSALQRDYICNLCEKGFLSKNTLRKHVVLCLGQKKTSKKKKENNCYPCPVCGITYLYKYSLDKHNANVHNLKKIFKCLVCSQQFYNEETLTFHCRSRHGLGGSNIYKCPYCEASFNIRGDLNYHCKKAHNTNQYYVCETCLECFKSEETCKLHEESHGYCCDICMFRTKTESELTAHRSTHLYTVVHKCDRCSRTFKAKRDFTKHIKVHEREKNL